MSQTKLEVFPLPTEASSITLALKRSRVLMLRSVGRDKYRLAGSTMHGTAGARGGSENPKRTGFGGKGNGTPLQYSCLENPMDGGAW